MDTALSLRLHCFLIFGSLILLIFVSPMKKVNKVSAMFLEQREIYSYNNLSVRSLHIAHISQKVANVLIYLNTLCK